MLNPTIILYLLFFTLVSCEERTPDLKMVAEYNIDVKEPSGLCFGPNRETLYTVSDNNGNIYELNFEGEVVKKIKTDISDAEGIAYSNDTIYIVSEAKRKLYAVDLEGEEYWDEKVKNIGFYDDKNGLEGLSYNPSTGEHLILKEKPGEVFTFTRDMELKKQSRLKSFDDYSGIFFGEKNIWILSDQNRSIASYSKNFKLKKKYYLGRAKMEGIAVDENEKLVYIVSDDTHKLFVFKY